MKRVIAKWICIPVLTGMIAITANCQHFYLKPLVRYHLPFTHQKAPEYFDAAIVVETNRGFYYNYIITENNKFSLAKGPSYGLTAGYSFSNQAGIELGLNYFKNETSVQSEDIWPHFPLGSTSWQFRSFNASLLLVLTRSEGRMSFSGKAGVLSGLSSLGKSVFFERHRKTYKFNSSFSPGYVLAFEFGYSLTKMFSITAEAGIENQFCSPRKASLKYDDFSYTGLDDLPVYLKEITYVREVNNEKVFYDTQTNTYYTDYFKPLLRLKESLKLNSVFFGLGVKYNLGK